MSNILNFIEKLPGQSAIVIRHAERYDITCAGDYWTCGLTDVGIKQAADFGTALAGNFDSYRLFHSPVKRCQQTAESIAESLTAAGKEVQSIEPERQLSVLSYMHVDEVQGFREADRFGKNFIRAWFDGQVDSDIYKSLQITKNEHLAYLQVKFSTANGGRHLDIHVTHDWNINVLREGIFGIRHEDTGWPDFLTGLGFSAQPFTAFIENNGQIITSSTHPVSE